MSKPRKKKLIEPVVLTDAECVTFHASLECVRSYEQPRSLRSFRHYIAHRLAQQLSMKVHGLLQVYVRHPLCTDVCPVSFFRISDRQISQASAHTYLRGLHPACKVLDSLVSSAKHHSGISLRIDYVDEEAPHSLCGMTNLRPGDPRPLLPRFAAGPKTGNYGHYAVFLRSKCGSSQKTFLDILNSLHEASDTTMYPSLFADRALLHESICGVETLANSLGVPLSLFGYKALVAAILESYVAAHDLPKSRTAITIVTPPSDPFGFGLGATLVVPREKGEDDLTSIMAEVLRKEHRLTTEFILGNHALQLDKQSADAAQDSCRIPPSDGMKRIRQFHHLFTPDHSIPQSIGRHIKSQIRARYALRDQDTTFLKDRARDDGSGHSIDLAHSIQSFLALCQTFCDEEHENVAIEYGLLLSNPALLEVFPGPRLIPLCKPKHKDCFEWQPVDSIRRRIELVADPRDRCIVFPFDENLSAEAKANYPAFVMELRPFRDMSFALPETALWSSSQANYIAITLMCPWTIAATAGPGAQVRVYACGDLVAYRDGKGWKVWEDPVADLRANSGELGDAALDRLRCIIDLSKQLSRYVRTGRKGALILYEPDVRRMEKWMKEGRLSPLTNVSVPCLGGEPWEANRSLFLPNPGGKGVVLNHDTARFIFRAAALDGAICLAGEDAKVLGIAQNWRLDTEQPGTHVGGTKRLAAQGFASSCSSEGFAIAISTDGPMRLFFRPPTGTVMGPINCFRSEL